MALAARIAKRLGRAPPSERLPQARMRAAWNGAVLAESDRTIKLEGNHYFPPDSLNREYLSESRRKSVCPWKGLASYYTVEVDGRRNKGAAWTYRHPNPPARRIKDHVAFGGDVEVSPAE